MKSLTHICLLVLLLAPSWLRSQLPLQIHPPALSPTNPTVVDLLSGTVQNTTLQSYQVRLTAVITKNTNVVGTATSAAFPVDPNVTLVINSTNAEQLLSPVRGEYYSPQDRAYTEQTGTLPPGDYEICVTAYNDTSQTVLGLNCYLHSVMDLNPPILILPMDGEVVQQPFPTFVWTPPTPLPAQPTYRLRIAPLLSNQSPIVALASNTAFHDVDGLGTNLYQYPVSARMFEPGWRYAWQVAVYQDNALITQSEVFTFLYANPGANNGGGTGVVTIGPSSGGGTVGVGNGSTVGTQGSGTTTLNALDKVILAVAMDDRDTLIERMPQDLRFFKDNGELSFSEQTYFTAPVTVYAILDKDLHDISKLLVFEPVTNGSGYLLQLVAPGNQSGQTYDYIMCLTPGGQAYTYKFRK